MNRAIFVSLNELVINQLAPTYAHSLWRSKEQKNGSSFGLLRHTWAQVVNATHKYNRGKKEVK